MVLIVRDVSNKMCGHHSSKSFEIAYEKKIKKTFRFMKKIHSKIFTFRYHFQLYRKWHFVVLIGTSICLQIWISIPHTYK